MSLEAWLDVDAEIVDRLLKSTVYGCLVVGCLPCGFSVSDRGISLPPQGRRGDWGGATPPEVCGVFSVRASSPPSRGASEQRLAGLLEFLGRLHVSECVGQCVEFFKSDAVAQKACGLTEAGELVQRGHRVL